MIRSAANSIYYAHRQALLQAAEVDALRRGLSPELQRVGLSMWRAVLAAWKDRTPHVDIQGVLERKALAPLVDGALNAHAIGWKSAQQTPDDATPIRFSLLKETLATLKDAGDIDALQSQYKVDCLRMLTKASTAAEAALRDKMNELISRGAHTRDGIKELAMVFEAQGLSSNARMLETIFRTQHQIAYAAGRWRADQDSDVSDFIWGYRYTIVGGPDGDGRNRPSHIKLNGVTLPKEDPFWKTHWPPNGWNCRCQAVQVWKKATVVAAPKGVEPDKGFSFNSGEIFAPAVEKKESAPVVRVPTKKATPPAKVESTPPQPSAAAKQATVKNYSNKKADPQVTATALKDLGIDPTKKENRAAFAVAQAEQLKNPVTKKESPKSSAIFPTEREPRKSIKVTPEESAAMAAGWKTRPDAAAVEEALSTYSTNENKWINGALRNVPGYNAKNEDNEKRIEIISKVIAESKAPDKPLYRGLRLDAKKKSDLLMQLESLIKSGEPLEMRGFTSTSLDVKAAAAFAGDSKVIFEIKAKRGIYLNGASQHENEQEVILNHGEKYRVVSVQRSATYSTEQSIPVGKVAKVKKTIIIIQLEQI